MDFTLYDFSHHINCNAFFSRLIIKSICIKQIAPVAASSPILSLLSPSPAHDTQSVPLLSAQTHLRLVVFLIICMPHKNWSDLAHSPRLPADFYETKINKLEIKAFSSGYFKISLYLCSVPFLSFQPKNPTKNKKQTSLFQSRTNSFSCKFMPFSSMSLFHELCFFYSSLLCLRPLLFCLQICSTLPK